MLRNKQNIYYILRIACAMCFIGHGAFGLIGKPIWCNYFALFGIGPVMAYKLMPVLGSIDILFGMIMLVYPVRVIALWLIIWGLITAALRPLSGEPFPEFIERAGNFGAPLVLLILCGTGKEFSSWFKRINILGVDRVERLESATLYLRLISFLLLAGHGWLNIIGKKGLITQYTTLGFYNAHHVAMIAGTIEITMALFVLIKPVRSVLLICLIWKIGTELFYPNWEAFEWIERGGSYGILLTLLVAACCKSSINDDAAKAVRISLTSKSRIVYCCNRYSEIQQTNQVINHPKGPGSLKPPPPVNPAIVNAMHPATESSYQGTQSAYPSEHYYVRTNSR